MWSLIRGGLLIEAGLTVPSNMIIEYGLTYFIIPESLIPASVV